MTMGMRTINLILPMPPSANRYWRHMAVNGRAQTFVSQEAKTYKREVAEAASLHVLIESEVEVSVKVFRAQRSGDLDNRLKCLLDALQGVVYRKDSQVQKIIAERFEDKHHPRVEVSITVLGLL